MTRLAWMPVLGLGCQAAPPREREPAPSAPAPAPAPESEREVTGIGIRPVTHAAGIAIGQLFPDGPADRAGLREGDVIVEVDGEPTARWSLDRAAGRLRGAAGSTVVLVAKRAGEPFEVLLQRRAVAVP